MRFETRIDVDATPLEVWAVLADVAAWPDFIPTVTAVAPLDDGPLGVGSTVRVKQPRMPALVWLVTEWNPGKSFTWQAGSPGVTTVATHTLTQDDGGSTAVVLGIAQTGWLATPVSLLTGRRTRQYVTTEAACLKQRCEAPRH